MGLAEDGITAHDYYARTDGMSPAYYGAFPSASVHVRCRKSVAAKLVQVNEALAPRGLKLLVLNSYRLLQVQSDSREFFIKRAKEALPAPTEVDRTALFAGEYHSNPRAFDTSDSHTSPTHIAGGAVDVALRAKETGAQLMGGNFDEPSTLSHTQYFEMELKRKTASNHPMPLSHTEALRNRRRLFWRMSEAGFANYPCE